ncbi:MAG: DNA-binding protein Alba [Candidatus Woesearchaeota archaeon]|nr:DNA-binding protein Alba [Candidatus Woesearchaeota archaeon]
MSESLIFVGAKPFMSYVTGVVLQFTTRGASLVHIRARGKWISKAVDIAEISTKRFLMNQAKVQSISIDSEQFKNEEGRDVRVSVIEIVLAKVTVTK